MTPTVVPVVAACGVHLDPVPERSPQQLAHGHPQLLAQQVPQRHVWTREGQLNTEYWLLIGQLSTEYCLLIGCGPPIPEMAST